MAGVADIFDAKKNWLARGLYNQKSQIRVRVLTWQQETIDGDFFARRFQQALALRQRHLSASTNAYRVANGEGDFLPGLIVDRYADFLVCQFFTAGMALFKDDIVEAVSECGAFKGIFERSEGRVGGEEGLEPSVGVLRGEAPPDTIAIEENDYKFLVDIRRGQKTGFFLDQRDNRGFFVEGGARPNGFELLFVQRRFFGLRLRRRRKRSRQFGFVDARFGACRKKS